MKSTCVFLFLLVFFAQQISAQKIERRLALVIGNGKYNKNTPSLPNPTVDADSIARALKDCHFDVMPVVKNADLKKMQESILAFSQRIRKEKYDVGLVFYAGHGININGINYFVPTDFDVSNRLAKDEAAARAKLACVSVENWLQETLIEAGESGKTFILLSDACRDNPYRGITRSLSANPWTDSLNTKKLPSDFFSSYSASQGQKAKDQSTYIKSLLRHIRTKNISIETLFKQVNKDMANSNQAPQVVSELTREFYFMPSSIDTTEKKLYVGNIKLTKNKIVLYPFLSLWDFDKRHSWFSVSGKREFSSIIGLYHKTLNFDYSDSVVIVPIDQDRVKYRCKPNYGVFLDKNKKFSSFADYLKDISHENVPEFSVTSNDAGFKVVLNSPYDVCFDNAIYQVYLINKGVKSNVESLKLKYATTGPVFFSFGSAETTYSKEFGVRISIIKNISASFSFGTEYTKNSKHFIVDTIGGKLKFQHILLKSEKSPSFGLTYTIPMVKEERDKAIILKWLDLGISYFATKRLSIDSNFTECNYCLGPVSFENPSSTIQAWGNEVKANKTNHYVSFTAAINMKVFPEYNPFVFRSGFSYTPNFSYDGALLKGLNMFFSVSLDHFALYSIISRTPKRL